MCEVMAVCQGVEAEAAHHETHREIALRYGWLVLQCQTPVTIPVLRRGVWCLLDDAGGFTRVPAPQEAG